MNEHHAPQEDGNALDVEFFLQNSGSGIAEATRNLLEAFVLQSDELSDVGLGDAPFQGLVGMVVEPGTAAVRDDGPDFGQVDASHGGKAQSPCGPA